MSIMYITENDKNGRARFYKVIDGKKKVVSRSEFESNTKSDYSEISYVDEIATIDVEEAIDFESCSEHQLTLSDISTNSIEEPEVSVHNESSTISSECNLGHIFADVVNSILSASYKKPQAKITKTKKYIVVNYQNCMVLSLVVNESGTVSAIRFKGTSNENRKDVRVYPFSSSTNISEFRNEIAKQIEFIEYEHSVKNSSSENKSA